MKEFLLILQNLLLLRRGRRQHLFVSLQSWQFGSGEYLFELAHAKAINLISLNLLPRQRGRIPSFRWLRRAFSLDRLAHLEA